MLADDEVPEPEPLQIMNSAPPPQLALPERVEELERAKSGGDSDRFMNIKSEELKQNHATNAALSKMFPSQAVNLELDGDDESLLHEDLAASADVPKVKQTILTQSDKEFRSILFIQAMVRVFPQYNPIDVLKIR